MASQKYGKEINKVFIHEIIAESKALKFIVNFHQQKWNLTYLSVEDGCILL